MEDEQKGTERKEVHQGEATGRRPGSTPGTALASPDALAVANRAAESVGLDLQELADLFVDGGLAVMPSNDGITESYTLEELGKRLWSTMQEVSPSKRSEWFHGLLPAQQVAVIVVLRDRGFRTQVIAQEFAMKPLHVIKVWNEHCDNLGAQVVGLRLNTIAGQMQLAAERAQDIAADKGDAATFWRVEKDKIAVLQSLGIVDRAIHKIEHTHKFDEQQRAEIDALVELRQKQERRGEEIKEIEAEVVDRPPEMESYDAE